MKRGLTFMQERNNLIIMEKKQTSQLIIVSFKVFVMEIAQLIKSPVFILLTILGNLLITLFSLIFFWLEYDQNKKLTHFMDALWWGFATATTTGYGDITPVTIMGKILGIILMLTGMALFAMFTALFAETILASTKKKNI
jgi:voltage-gated potassium channel